MRVIAGIAKGTKLVSPPVKLVRPALDRVKESLFSILADISGLRILDIFAGSGSIGIEALSRKADFCVFVELSNQVCETINKNLKKCKFENNAKVFRMNHQKAIEKLSKSDEKFDLIFVDPPYFKELIIPTLQLLCKNNLLKEGALVVAEHHEKEELKLPPGWCLTDKRSYGQTVLSFLKV